MNRSTEAPVMLEDQRPRGMNRSTEAPLRRAAESVVGRPSGHFVARIVAVVGRPSGHFVARIVAESAPEG
jgi:hypothetical protein